MVKPVVTLDDLVAAYRRVNERFFRGLDAMDARQRELFEGSETLASPTPKA